MTVGAFTDSANRLTFTADSSTVSYSFNFEIADKNSIEVYVDNVLKSISSDYSVSFNSGTSGAGNIIFNSAPSSSSTIILKRDTLLTRETNFQTGGAFNASNINNELDRLTQGLQEADDKIQNRVLRVDNFSSAPTDFTIPSTRADMFLKFDSGGDVTVTDSFEGSTITTTGDVTVGGALNVSGSLSLSTLSVSGNVSGTLTTAAQPNITSLGTLSALTVDNISLDGNTVASSTGTLAVDDNVTVNGTIVASGAITGSTLTGTLQTAAQSNITSLGTLTALDVDNINLNGNTIVSSTGTLAIDDNTTVNGSLTATTLGGTLSTAAQTNITSLGTLTSLDVDGVSINGNNISATRTNDDLKLIPSGTGQVVIDGNISATNIAGTITTAAQPNITSLGTLSSLQTDNININGNTISTTSGNLTLSNLTSVSIDSINFADNKISTNASNADLQLDANGTGTIDVLDNRISNLADAVNNKDAVSKGFLNTTLTNAGISPTGEVTFQSTIDNGSSSVKVESTDGDVHMTLASSLLYKFKSNEFESLLPISVTGTISNEAVEINNNKISAKRSNDDLQISASGTGSIVLQSALSLGSNEITTDSIQIADNKITTTRSNDNLVLDAAGSGKIDIGGLKFPSSDGSADQVLATDGSGNLSFTTISSTAISQNNTNVTVTDSGSNGTVTITADGNTEMTVTDDGVRVHGNLTVDGTQTIINTTTLSVEDNVIELNRNVSNNAGMPTFSGLKVNRGELSSATEQDLFWAWDESFADDGTTIFGNAGGAWTAFKSANDNMSANTLVDIRANIVHAIATGAQYSDVAERYAADDYIQKGTVVSIGGTEEITTATEEMSENVFGVVSTQPAFMMNASAGNNDSHPFVAMVGRVPVRVIGLANKGDRIVLSSTKGVARVVRANENPTTEQVIGRVLQDKIDNAEHTIECVVQCRV